MENIASDLAMMRHAIGLAASHVGRTGENPSVGCVIIQSGHIVGKGVTGLGGRPHAEEVALAQAGTKAKGATAYVTLEPCAERSTGGNSCTQRLMNAGISRVLVACKDPSHLASGRGIATLQSAGLGVEVGLLEDEARALYAGYKPMRPPTD